jgi:hypothetical protein
LKYKTPSGSFTVSLRLKQEKSGDKYIVLADRERRLPILSYGAL